MRRVANPTRLNFLDRAEFYVSRGIAEQGYKRKDECESLVDKWIYNIKHMGPMQEVAFKSKNEIFKRLERVASVATLTPEERYSYDADVKNARDTLNQIRGAYHDGEKKGRAEGKADILKALSDNGLSLDEIAKLTGLSHQSISSILN